MTTQAMTVTTAEATYEQSAAAQLKSHYLADRLAAAEFSEMLAPRRRALEERINAIRDAFAEENAELLHSEKAFTESADAYEQELRSLAIQHFNLSGEKTLDENLSVRVQTKISYDEEKAVGWALLNAPILVRRTVDRKQFEEMAKRHRPDFVTFEDSVVAVIKGLSN